MGKTPAEQLQPGIDYLEKILSKNPTDRVIQSMLTKLKKEQKEYREKWRPRYHNIEECTGSIF